MAIIPVANTSYSSYLTRRLVVMPPVSSLCEKLTFNRTHWTLNASRISLNDKIKVELDVDADVDAGDNNANDKNHTKNVKWVRCGRCASSGPVSSPQPSVVVMRTRDLRAVEWQHLRPLGDALSLVVAAQGGHAACPDFSAKSAVPFPWFEAGPEPLFATPHLQDKASRARAQRTDALHRQIGIKLINTPGELQFLCLLNVDSCL